MKFNLARLIFVTIIALIPIHAFGQTETVFIKYKNYQIPIQVAPQCELTEAELGKPRVFYIDDVENSFRSVGSIGGRKIFPDSNGVNELPIILGWAERGFYTLVGLGAASVDGLSFRRSYVQGLVNLAERNASQPEFPAVTVDQSLSDAIIAEAVKFQNCDGQRLQIVVGGPWHAVNNAVSRAIEAGTPIDKLVFVSGVGGSNVTNRSSDSSRKPARDAVISSLGEENVRELSVNEFLRFMKPSNRFIGNIGSWYRTSFYRTSLGRNFRDSRLEDVNIRLNYCRFGSNVTNRARFCNKDIDGNDGNPANSEIPTGERYPFAGADFTALAYVIWGEETFEIGSEMYDRIDEGVRLLP